MSTAIEVHEGGAQEGAIQPSTGTEITLFQTSEPTEIVAKATKVATVLADVIRQKQLTSSINGREHVRCEGWTLLGTMLGVFPVLAWTRELHGGNGWEARVEARTMSGAIVGVAEAECTRDERNWSDRDSFALRSMAQTRATAKALRMPLGFVMTLAGYEATPAEEMPGEPAGTKAAADPEKAKRQFFVLMQQIGLKYDDVHKDIVLGALEKVLGKTIKSMNAVAKNEWPKVVAWLVAVKDGSKKMPKAWQEAIGTKPVEAEIVDASGEQDDYDPFADDEDAAQAQPAEATS